MINVSNAFKNELYLDRRSYLEYADITLSDGTELNLTNKDFWQGGMSLDDAVSGNDAFEIGAAIVNSCSLTIENLDDRFSEYDFLNAKVVIYVGLNLPDGTTEKIRKGTYTVNDPKYNGATISLNCQDNMAKFDRSYSESELTYPATLNQIVRDACSTCDVTLQTLTFSHSDFVVQTRPTDEAITFREVISWAAQIAGCFCRCDVQGRLELKWYNQQLLEKHGYDGGIFDKLDASKYTTGDNVDGGSFNPWDTGDTADGGTFEELEGIHHIYSHYSAPVISTDDVVITGVRVLEKAKEQDEETGSEKDAIITYQSGSDGYVVSIENNELIQGGAGLQISNWLGEQLIGFRFRKASLSHASDPTIEAGDIAIVTDRKQNTYPIIVSSTRFSTGSAQSTESSAETPARNSAARFSATTKNYVEYRKDIEKERTEREKAQEELKERIDSSSGLYTTEQTQPDGSTIFYMHDKPTLAESKIVWKMTAEAWGVSTDGGGTYNAGMTVDGDTIVRILTAVGINADWIKTGAFRIEKNGKVIFLADADTKRVEIVADSFSLTSGETIGSIAESAVNDFISKTYDPKIAELQKQLDGQIESFYYNYAPTLTNIPASGWTTETERAKHEGDLFYDKSTGHAYRFFKDGNSWKWQMIQDTDITKALANAATAQDTADHKRRTFLITPTPPYDKGDLWYAGTNSDVKVCTTARTSGSYVSTDWTKQDKYIDQSAANTAAANAVNGQTQESIFSKLTNNGQAKGIILKNGELYVSATYIQSGALKVAKNGRTLFLADIDTGRVDIVADTFSLSSGETIDSIAEGKANGALESAKNYADTASKNAVDNQTQQDIFNKLTGGGTNQGIYLEEKKLYLNAEYMATGILQSRDGTTFYLDLDKGILKMKATELTIAGQSVNQALSDAVTSIEQQYYQSNSATSLSGGSWGAAQPTWTQGKYIWNRQYVTYGNGETAYLPSANGVCITGNTGANGTNGTNGTNGKDGAPGKDGTNGANGVSVSSVVAQYYSHTSATSAPGTNVSWSEAMPAVSDNRYIWSRQKVTYSDKSITYTTPYCMTKTIGDIAQQKVDAQTQLSIFNKLTNNGQTQGIYLKDGKVYINAEYIQSGTLSADRIKGGTLTLGGSSNTNGSLRILNSSGVEVGSWNNSGLKAIAGTIGPWTINNQAIYNGITYTGNKRGNSTGIGPYGDNWAFWAGDGRFSVKQDGTLYAESGTFAGSLSGATGTFSGTLSAAGGTFNGTLSAATGSFNGDISGANGTFKGAVQSSGTYGSARVTEGMFQAYYGSIKYAEFGISGNSLSNFNIGKPLSGSGNEGTIYSTVGMLRYASAPALFVVGSSIYMEFMGSYVIDMYADLRIGGDFSVRGSKNRITPTKNYQDRLLYCYEMPSPMFGDIGEAVTDENGECYIFLDDIFSETVSAQIEYQVFLQKEGPGDIWIAEKTPQYFVVQGTENLKFAWEIKAKQKGYEYERLETYTKEEIEEIDYEQQYFEEFESLIKEQEGMYL